MILCYLYFIHAGICYSYFLRQLPLWAIFYMALLFWAVMSPFQYQSFKNAGNLKYVYTAMIIVGVLLPCVPVGVNVGFGYGIFSFSPMVCAVAVQDVGFYTDALFEGFEVAILGTLQALVCLTLVKVGHHYSFILVSLIPKPSVPCTKDLGMGSISCIMVPRCSEHCCMYSACRLIKLECTYSL